MTSGSVPGGYPLAMTRRDWWPMLLAMLPLMGWWSTGLFDLDEGFYGAITAEMNRRGEWITPYFAGRPWFEKPILLYWLAKPCLWLLGPDVGPRLPSVLMSIATLGMTYAFARHQRDARTAELAVLILGGSLLFAGPGRMMLTDPTLVACLTAMVYAMWLAETDARWRPIAGAALGLSILAKGPVGVLLLIPWLAYLAWRDPQFRIGLANGRAIGWIGFALAASAVTASWYLPAYLANGDAFVQGFLVEQNLRRFTGGDEAHTWRNPLNYLFFVPIFLLGMLPFSLHISAAVRQAKSDRFLRAMLAWAVVVFLFFTVSGAKLIHYIMPMFPPLAIV
ncbi:MAG: glycosyltransferase family 39 protein, partial [Fimbriimonadaceae bacterium]|nr:glycosyltransferase family 39 protein [Fimbriimonadaceae bacterium]